MFTRLTTCEEIKKTFKNLLLNFGIRETALFIIECLGINIFIFGFSFHVSNLVLQSQVTIAI